MMKVRGGIEMMKVDPGRRKNEPAENCSSSRLDSAGNEGQGPDEMKIDPDADQDECMPQVKPQAAPRTNPNGRTRRGERGGRDGPLACGKGGIDEEHGFVWPDDGTLSMLDDQHGAAGLWAIETANPNAWPATLEHLKATEADVILTQEVKKRRLRWPAMHWG